MTGLLCREIWRMILWRCFRYRSETTQPFRPYRFVLVAFFVNMDFSYSYGWSWPCIGMNFRTWQLKKNPEQSSPVRRRVKTSPLLSPFCWQTILLSPRIDMVTMDQSHFGQRVTMEKGRKKTQLKLLSRNLVTKRWRRLRSPPIVPRAEWVGFLSEKKRHPYMVVKSNRYKI